MSRNLLNANARITRFVCFARIVGNGRYSRNEHYARNDVMRVLRAFGAFGSFGAKRAIRAICASRTYCAARNRARAKAFQKCPSGVPRADYVSLGVPQNFKASLGDPQFFRSVPHSEGHIGFHGVPRLFSLPLKISECPLRVLKISLVSVITRDTPDLLLFLKR